MTIDPARTFRTLKTLDTFIDRSLNLKPKGKFLSGFHYELDILKASVANTYVETVGNRADSLHLASTNIKHLLGIPEDCRNIGNTIWTK